MWNALISIGMEKAFLDGTVGSSLLMIYCLANKLRCSCSSVNARVGWLDGASSFNRRTTVADLHASLLRTVVVAPCNP
jgi:hypothetical protein